MVSGQPGHPGLQIIIYKNIYNAKTSRYPLSQSDGPTQNAPALNRAIQHSAPYLRYAGAVQPGDEKTRFHHTEYASPPSVMSIRAQQREVIKLVLRKVSGILAVLCLLTLTGTGLLVSAQPLGADLELELPIDTMEVIGEYNVTIDPAENFTIEPVNLDAPLEVRRDTPAGALDAASRSGGANATALNYTTYYYTISQRLAVDSINEYVYQDDQFWLVLNDLNETFYETNTDALAHNLSDGETFWFIYCNLSDFDPEREQIIERAVAGLSITVTFGEGNATPIPTGDGNVTPTPVVDGNGASVPAVAGNATPTPTATGEQNGLFEVIRGDDNLSFMASLLNATNLPATLQGDGPYTVFAPQNDAFGNLSPEVFTGLLIDETERTRVLSNHVVNGSYTAAELRNMTEGGNATSLTTLAGVNLTVSVNGSVLMIDNATISGPEVNASNGVVHVIDTVLVPPASVAPVETVAPATNVTPTVNPIVNMTELPMGTI